MTLSRLPLALRTLFKTPLVTGVAIVSLAFGIGGTSAIFSLFDQIVLRPLPVHEPGRLVNLVGAGPKQGSVSSNTAGDSDSVFSYPMFRDLERQQTTFTGLAAHRIFGANLAYRGQTMSGEGLLVSGSYFPALGLKPALGRLFDDGDDRTPGGHPLVIVSHAYWKTRFDQSSSVLNDTLVVNGQSLTIVGVAPAGFDGTTLGPRPQVFVPLTMRGLMEPGWKGFEERRDYWVYLFARLKPGVTLEQAQVAVNAPYSALIRDVEAPLQKGMSEPTLKRFTEKRISLEDGTRGQSEVNREAREPLLLLFGVTGFVLLIACANIANLLLARGASRSTEMAVRMSIGASRGQLVRQLLGESCLLAAFGGVAGVFVAYWTLKVIASILPPEAAAIVTLRLDPRMLGFATALSLGTGLLFGIFPSLHATRAGLVSGLKGRSGGTRSGARSASFFRTALATGQIFLSMMLLVSAGLFVKSLVKVSRVDLGLKVENVVTFRLSPDLNGYSPERTRAFFERVEDEIGAVPGVTGVTASRVPLIANSNWGSNVSVQGFDAGPDTDTDSNFNAIGPGYFRTLGIPLLAGREFTRADAAGTGKVAIVNEAFARKFNLGREAVGKRMQVGRGGDMDIEIVGLVRDAKYSDVKRVAPPQFFRPYRQEERLGAISFYARSAVDPVTLLGAVPAVIARLDPNLPVEDLRTFEMQVRESVFLDRMISTLSAAFAGLATLLAAIGLYGVLAYTVAQRTREIGLRMALGADPGRVRRMVLRQVTVMTIVGGSLGLAGAIGIGRLARALLFEVEGHDPIVLASAAAALAIVAFGAGFVPAQRAAQIDPMQALRYE